MEHLKSRGGKFTSIYIIFEGQFSLATLKISEIPPELTKKNIYASQNKLYYMLLRCIDTDIVLQMFS